MRFDTIVQGRAFVNGGFQDVEIGIDEGAGTIAAVKRSLTGSRRLRFPGCVIVPSAVDLHVHLRDPGRPAKETFASGTRAAALGGVGAVFDMPNTVPIVDSVRRLEEKQAHVQRKACVDYGLWATVTQRTPDAPALADRCAGLKLYLAASTAAAAATAAECQAAFQAARSAGRIVALHAETPTAGTANDLAGHHLRSSPQGETRAVEAVMGDAGDQPVHVAHATTHDLVKMTSLWPNASVGVTPHHLLLACESDLGPKGKVNPPLRPRAMRDDLWAAFASGASIMLETDHAPHTVDEKSQPFSEAPAGIPSLEDAYALMLRECQRRGVDTGLAIEAYATRPARRMGLACGRIEKGALANLAVFSARNLRRVRAADGASEAGWSPYEGREAWAIVAHALRGQWIVEDGVFTGRPGLGINTPPQPLHGSSQEVA